MIILSNEEIDPLLSMEKSMQHLESAYRELSETRAVNRPRTDLYLPSTTTGGVYCFKTMEGGLTQEKVVALRLNSDVISWEQKGARIIKEKVPAAAGSEWVFHACCCPAPWGVSAAGSCRYGSSVRQDRRRFSAPRRAAVRG